MSAMEMSHGAQSPVAPNLHVLDRPVQGPDDMMVVVLQDKDGTLTEGKMGKMEGEV